MPVQVAQVVKGGKERRNRVQATQVVKGEEGMSVRLSDLSSKREKGVSVGKVSNSRENDN